jgi:hypothetical protein
MLSLRTACALGVFFLTGSEIRGSERVPPWHPLIQSVILNCPIGLCSTGP